MATDHSTLTGANLHNVKQHNHDADTEAGGGKLSGAVVDTYLELAEGAAPGTPGTGLVRLYAKTDGSLYQKDDAGSETGLAGGGGGGGAPADATYVVESANGTLSAESVLGTAVITQAAHASRQAAASAGRLFFPTNAPHIARDDGSAWDNYGPIFPLVAPSDSGFSWVNQGTATLATTQDMLHLAMAAGTGDNIRARVKTAPSTPYTITVCMLPTLLAQDFHSAGLLFRQSSDGKLHLFSQVNATNLKFDSIKWSSPTTPTASYRTGIIGDVFKWLRIADDGSNRICSYSQDGQNWQTFHSVGRTDYLTADQVGFYVNPNNATFGVGLSILSWLEA